MADINKYNFIKNIEQVVQNKMLELNLKPKKPLNLKELKKDNRRFYSVPCKYGNKQVFLKMLVVTEDYPAYEIKKEINITKFLSGINLPAARQKKQLNIPLFVDGDTENFPYWFTHEFLPGPLVGYFYEMHKPGFEIKKIKQIVDNLLDLQSISTKKYKKQIEKISLPTANLKRHLEEIDFRKGFLKKEKNIPFGEIIKFVKDREKYFVKARLVIAHGDFNLANFFIYKNKVYTTDFERVHLNNFAADIAHLWGQTWRYPKWRKKLIIYFLSKLPQNKKEIFKELFRSVMLIEALGTLAFNSEICEKKYKAGAKKSARDTIQASFKSFNDLINL
jgi:hypothetical protein